MKAASLDRTNSSTWRWALRRERHTSRIAEEAFGREESSEESNEKAAAAPSAPPSSGVQQLRQLVSRVLLLELLLLLLLGGRARDRASQVEQSGSGKLWGGLRFWRF